MTLLDDTTGPRSARIDQTDGVGPDAHGPDAHGPGGRDPRRDGTDDDRPAGAPTVGSAADPTAWVDVCAVEDLDLDRGAAALIAGEPVAVFRCSPDGALFAIGNIDPYSDASVLARGIVGSIGDRRVVASPVYKNRFDLETGVALEDPGVRVAVHQVEIADGRVRVATRRCVDAPPT